MILCVDISPKTPLLTHSEENRLCHFGICPFPDRFISHSLVSNQFRHGRSQTQNLEDEEAPAPRYRAFSRSQVPSLPRVRQLDTFTYRLSVLRSLQGSPGAQRRRILGAVTAERLESFPFSKATLRGWLFSFSALVIFRSCSPSAAGRKRMPVNAVIDPIRNESPTSFRK